MPFKATTPTRAKAVLDSSRYPYRSEWTLDMLGRCLLYATEAHDVLLWFLPLSRLAVELHAFATPEARGRWASRQAINGLGHSLQREGYRHIVARPTPRHMGLISRLGFEPVGPFWILPL